MNIDWNKHKKNRELANIWPILLFYGMIILVNKKDSAEERHGCHSKNSEINGELTFLPYLLFYFFWNLWPNLSNNFFPSNFKSKQFCRKQRLVFRHAQLSFFMSLARYLNNIILKIYRLKQPRLIKLSRSHSVMVRVSAFKFLTF